MLTTFEAESAKKTDRIPNSSFGWRLDLYKVNYSLKGLNFVDHLNNLSIFTQIVKQKEQQNNIKLSDDMILFNGVTVALLIW